MTPLLSTWALLDLLDTVARLIRRLNGLAARIRSGMADAADFRRARAELDLLPLSTTEFAVALNRLENARRYLFADEPGAAVYELRLLIGSLRELNDRRNVQARSLSR